MFYNTIHRKTPYDADSLKKGKTNVSKAMKNISKSRNPAEKIKNGSRSQSNINVQQLATEANAWDHTGGSLIGRKRK